MHKMHFIKQNANVRDGGSWEYPCRVTGIVDHAVKALHKKESAHNRAANEWVMFTFKVHKYSTVDTACDVPYL